MNQQEQNKKTKQKKPTLVNQSKSHIYACFQQPQTIDILPYLSMPIPNKLLFDSAMKSVNKQSGNEECTPIVRRVKEYKFQRIYCRQEKFKYAFSQEISYIIEKLFQGFNQTVFIYGTEQSKKDKILIGQSQNSGFLLNTLAQIFQYCHEKQIEDEVTVKISCSIFKQGKFIDPFKICQSQCQNQSQKNDSTGNVNNVDNKRAQNDKNPNNTRNSPSLQQQQTMVCQDTLEGAYFLGLPEVIVRNMRTALKLINLITKKISQRRQSIQQQNTQNIIFTVKLQIDTAYDKQSTGEVYEYSIPKLYIVKLANPSINNTLNGVNKKNQWFINMFNFLQSEVLQQKGVVNKKVYENNNINIVNANNNFQASQKQLAQILSAIGVTTSDNGVILPFDDNITDPFTDYIKTVVMHNAADIHCFTSLTNKLTSNQCLTAFIFNNYLSSYQTQPKKTILNVKRMKNQKNNYEEQLINLFTVREMEVSREKKVTDKYREEYGIRLGEWGSKKESVWGVGSGQVGKEDRQKVKAKQQAVINKRLQKDFITSTQSQKRLPNAPITPSPNVKPESSIIKQSLKHILSLSCDSQGQIQSIQSQLKLSLLKYIHSINEFTNCCNIVQYEYAQVLSIGCEKLNKYIFNQQVEEFFYAKKISLDQSDDLKTALRVLKQQKVKLIQMQERILRKITTSVKIVTSQLEILREINARQQHQQFFKIKKIKLTSLLKQRQLLTKLFQYYNTMSFHYIYENNQKLIQLLQKEKKHMEEEFEKRNNYSHTINYEEIMKNIKKGFYQRIMNKKTAQSREQSMLKDKEGRDDDDDVNDDEKDSQSPCSQQPKPNLESTTNEKSQQKTHYLSKSRLTKQKSLATQKVSPKINCYQQSFSRIDQSRQNNKITSSDNLKQLTEKAAKYKMRKKQDQLHNMFTNSNVGLTRPQFYKRNK